MLASINPLGERGRNQRYAITVTVYIASAVLAALALGALLGALGRPLARPPLAVPAILVVAAGGLACDAGLFGWRVPGPRRQVDENWLVTYRGWVYGAGFGVQLGAAFTTIVTASATWVAFACALGSGSAAAGAVIGAAFGLARALPVLLTARIREPAALRARMRTIDRGRAPLARATAAAQVLAVLVLLGVTVGLVW